MQPAGQMSSVVPQHYFFLLEFKFGCRNASGMGSGRNSADSNVLVVLVVPSCFAGKYLCFCQVTGRLLMYSSSLSSL